MEVGSVKGPGMLTSQENEILTQVGPATPMGAMMRRFWLPVCTSAQLPEPDSDPVRRPAR